MKKTFFCFFLLSASAFAQERTVASGSEAIGTGGSISYSIGLIDYKYHISSSGNVTEGVQQSFSVSTSDVESWDLSYDFNVYPNPTSSYLTISSSSFIQAAKCEIVNLQGQVILTQALENESTLINVSHLAPSTYLLNVLVNDKRVRVYSIIKSH